MIIALLGIAVFSVGITLCRRWLKRRRFDVLPRPNLDLCSAGPYRTPACLSSHVKMVRDTEDPETRRAIGGHWEREANFAGDWGSWLPWTRVDSCQRKKLPLQFAVQMLMEFDRDCEDYPMPVTSSLPCSACGQRTRTADEEKEIDRELSGWYIDSMPKLPHCEKCGQRKLPRVVGDSNCSVMLPP